MFIQDVEHREAFAECQRAYWKTCEYWSIRSGVHEVAVSSSLLMEIRFSRTHI